VEAIGREVKATGIDENIQCIYTGILIDVDVSWTCVAQTRLANISQRSHD
jgi:hypothetical protein